MTAHGLEARRLLRSRRHGTLSTLSRRHEGYPFGSVVPFVLDADGCPVILVSDLAEHTKNLAADGRVSLLVHEPGEDVQAASRATLVGDAGPVADVEAARARHARYLPESEGLLSLGDFRFHRIVPRAIRFIAGFGAIHWVSAESYRPPQGELAAAEAGILDHMNAEHAANLVAYCRHVHGVDAGQPRMIGIDCDGFDVRAGERILRFAFDTPVLDADGAREALVRLARESSGARG